MPQLAFFPWIALGTDIDVGDYSLKRFVRGKLPCPADGLQKTLDTVLAPFCIHRGEPIKHAVILVRHGRAPTGELSAEDRANLFEFAELFAFAALAARRFFWPDYLNRDHLRLVIQAFSDREGGASMQLRRRDGQERLWIPGDCDTVQAPAHVSSGGHRMQFDGALLKALLAAREDDQERWSGLRQGIGLFNQANTDAPDTSPDTELVLTYAAMEQILGLVSRGKQKQMPTRFADTWSPRRDIPKSEWRPAPPNQSWKGDKFRTLRARWADDLGAARRNLAHGNAEDREPSIWTVRQHLLLTSFAIPRLVKRILTDMDLYELTDDDHGDINALEPLLNLPDVFAKSDPDEEEQFEWRRVLAAEHDRQVFCYRVEDYLRKSGL